jgi:iron complex outermembrane receptor protein|tara:strand:- start:19092 stop:21521 length:2430 start_codon:yes stop_codon:yes gene_type:complete
MKSKIAISMTASVLAIAAVSAPALAQETGAAEDAASTSQQPASAPSEASPSGGGFGEIIVTANKRSENLQKVPISMSAYSGEQLERLGVTDTTQITQQIPGLQVNTWSPSFTIFNLRGISQNNFTDNLEAPVAVYMDNAYVGSLNAVSGQLFDTERVEVLRGPQGTLFGRNATGGLIHYLSRDASESYFNGYVEASYGRYNDRSLEGAVGGSFSDNMRFRAAGRVNKADGYIISKGTDVDGDGIVDLQGSGQDLGGKNGWSGRLTFQFDVTPDFLLNMWVKHSRDTDVATGGYVFENCDFQANGYCSVDDVGLSNGTSGVINGITGLPASPYENFGERLGSLDRKSTTVQADATWEVADGVTLTAITNHLDVTKDYQEDGDALPVQVLDFDTDVDFEQFSQELRLAGDTDAFKWQVGAYYLNMTYDGSAITVGAPVIGQAVDLNGAVDSPVAIQEYFLKSKNWSVFGQVDYNLTDELSLTLGGRYSVDDKSIDYQAILRDPAIGPDVELGSSAAFDLANPGVNTIDYKDWAARVGLNYQMNSDTLLFVSWNRGIKGGNWSLGTSVQANDFKHRPETLNSFEGGIKTALLNRTLKVNATVFHYIYDDYQAFSLAGGTPQVSNSDARSTGAELELFWSPSNSFDAIIGATWQTSEVKNVVGPGDQFGPEFFPGAPDAQFCSNGGGFFFCDYPVDTIPTAELPNAPNFSLNYLFRYNMDVGAGNLAAQVDGAWYDDQFLEVTNGLSSLQKSYNVTNASLTYSHEPTGISLEGWVRNMFGKEYRAYALNLGILGTTSVYAQPTTYGATARVKF